MIFFVMFDNGLNLDCLDSNCGCIPPPTGDVAVYMFVQTQTPYSYMFTHDSMWTFVLEE